MIAFFRKLAHRLDRADAYDDERAIFYEERLSHLADRIKELQELYGREREVIEQRLEIHDGRIKALDYWTQSAGSLLGAGRAPVDLETQIETSGDPLDVENWDDELSLTGMTMWPAPHDASES